MIRSLALVALTAAFGLFSAGAQAVSPEVNYVGPNVNMGPVFEGQYGDIDVSALSANAVVGPYLNIASGLLPEKLKITFTYDAQDVSFETLVGQGFSGTSGAPDYTFSSAASNGFYADNTDLIIASAGIDAGTGLGTVSVSNLMNKTINFTSLFSGIFGAKGFLNVSYAVSAVPLPAALPMFGAALVGLGALRRRRAKKA